MFLAYRGKKVVGRIAGIWHKGVNEKYSTKQLRFTRFDTVDDFEVTKALFDKLFSWAKEIGMTEIIGPMSFSDLNEEGMLIDGFDEDSCYIELYNYPYYVEHMEKLGAYKVVDWNCYRVYVPEEIDPRLSRLCEVIKKRNGYTLLDIKGLLKKDKKKLDSYLMQCMDVMDEAFAKLYGTSPLNEKQKARMLGTVKMALVPEFAAAVLKDDKVVAYGFIMPSMLKVLQKAKGNVFPGGILPYIKAMKKSEVADMMSVGVLPSESNRGAVALVIESVLRGCIARGVKVLETGPELEENANVQNLWKNYQHELVKRHRCWGLKVE